MKTVKIALARFYNAKFVTLIDKEEIVWQLAYADMQVVARLSKTTSYTKWGPSAFGLAKKQSSPYETNLVVHPGPDKYPADLYFEVIAYKHIEVTDEKATSLANGDLPTRDELLKQFGKHEPELKEAIEYGAGMLGLRVHPELVTIPIFDVDQRYLFINDDAYSVQAGFVIEVRGTVDIFYQGEGIIQHSTDNLKLRYKQRLAKSSECLSWLLRGWGAEDYVLRFISFFTALECIMPGYPHFTNTSAFVEKREKLIELIENSNELKDIDPDLYLFRQPPRVDLVKRFTKLTEDSKLENAETDIVDFIKYNKLRNAILHRGDTTIDATPHVTNETLKQFEIFAQKYIREILYGKVKNVTPNSSRKTIVSVSGNFNK